MNHRGLLATIPQADRARLTARSSGPGLRRLGVHGGAILLLGAAIAARVPGWPLILPVQGVLLAFLFTLQHETTHKTPFADDRLNDWVGRIAGVLIVQPFAWFRYFHLAHHRHTNDPDRDPERAAEKPGSWPAFLWHLSTIGYWRDKAAVLWTNAFGRIEAEYLPRSVHPRLRREARVMLAAYALAAALMATVAPWLFTAWLLPLALGFPALRLYLLAEHGRCPAVADMFANTRTTFTTGLVRFLAWNMPYHAEHHAWPSVPFHKLPDLHRIARPHLKETEQGYARFTRRYAASLR
ncbi:fatty acid desaturase [Rhodosalinus halophilus]|uniref:Fatty acid desaturase n=1 Tax=Rhodosalinus halophilus TaxID=2259333 RepID=A0A365UCJ6_9RHOB|nr:fatty acid desaturase [Rhodosalinus halophilus]RBI86348.1 fatty acid desaturase [Rhodosalinus halophilus]